MSKRNESFGLYDQCEVVKLNKNREVVDRWDGEDLITNAGRVVMAGIALTDVGGNAFNFIAIGTGTLAASASQTALRGQKARLGATGTRTTTTVSGDTAKLVTIFQSGLPTGLNGYSTGSKAIYESGVFTNATSGSMLCRQTLGPFNMDWNGGDSLQITWKIKYS